jgi:hypothetical protein
LVIQRKENYIRVEDGPLVFQAHRRDPYGFWSVEGKKEKKAIQFDSEYTSSTDVMKAIETRINDLKKTSASPSV